MSFYSAFRFVRPLQPPIIAASDLAEFASHMFDAGIVQSQSPATIRLKFGTRVDQDERDTHREEPVNAVVSTVREIEWDVDRRGLKTASEIVTAIADERQPIYRALLMFDLDRDVQQRLTREPGPENNVGFFPGDLSIQVGPIYAHDLATEPPIPMVGWIGAGISGSGYFFP